MTNDPNLPSSTDVDEQSGDGIDLGKAPTDQGVGEADAGDLHEIVLKVGPGGVRKQRFVGRLVGEQREYTKAGTDLTRVYLSRKGKYVVHRQHSSWKDHAAQVDWSDWSDWKQWLGLADRAPEWGDFTLEVADSPQELRDRIPERIYRPLVYLMEEPSTQDLDI
ncbi:EXLDI protein [Nocardia sp. NPDC052566]|uniref:EXLDI protein n=1 Tax=Nocardia sp. NPDC052566 TaxID=3364330 RepID=UPI0037C59ABF